MGSRRIGAQTLGAHDDLEQRRERPAIETRRERDRSARPLSLCSKPIWELQLVEPSPPQRAAVRGLG